MPPVTTHRTHAAMVLANVAQYHFGQFDLGAAIPALDAAKDLLPHAQRVGTHHFVATVEGLHHFGCLALSDAERTFRTGDALTADHEDPWMGVFIKVGLPLVDILTGRLTRAVDEAAAAAHAAVETSQWHLHGLAVASGAAAAIGQGRIVDAEREGELAVQSFRRSDYFWAAAVGFPHLAAARAYRGDLLGAHRVLDEWGASGEPMVGRHRLRVELLCGSADGLRRLLDSTALLPLDPVPSLFTLNQALVAVEVGDRLDDLDLVRAGYAHLAAAPPDVRFNLEWCMGTRRVLALGALRLGELDAAEQWLADATEDARLAGSALELARAAAMSGRISMARGASAHEVLHLLEPALASATDAGLLAIAAEVRRALPESAWSRHRELVVLYTDLVSSTELNVRAGDDFFLELLREHNRIVRDRLAAFGGVEFTYTGDGVGARFASTDGALEFALGLQADFDDANERHPDFPLRVRIGLAHGDALEESGNLFGQTIVRAVRVCATAGAGQVLAGDDVVAEADPMTARFERLGSFELKGFAGRSELFEAAATGRTRSPRQRRRRTGDAGARMRERETWHRRIVWGRDRSSASWSATSRIRTTWMSSYGSSPTRRKSSRMTASREPSPSSRMR